MRLKTFNIVWCLLAFTQMNNVSAGINTDTLQQRLNTYHLEKPYLGLYVHMDKNTYLIGDTIWFKAYMLSSFTNEVLYVRMTNQHKDIVLEKKFSVYDIRSHGELVIPQDLPEGKYYFYAFTDRMMSLSSGEAFVQPVTIGKNVLNRIEAEASVVSPKKIHRGDPVEISVKVNGSKEKTLKGTFHLSNEGVIFKEGLLTVNSQGYAYIRFTYPEIPNNENLRCDIRFEDNKDVAELTLNLRHEGNIPQVKAYPEGGHLLEGVSGRVVIETQDERGNPLKAVIGFMENGKVVHTAESDKYGLSEFSFTPKKSANYRLQVTENDTTFQTAFPCTIETAGYSLRAHTDNKTVNAVLYNTGNSDSATLVVQSFNKIVWSQAFHTGTGDSVTVNLPAADLPAGLLNLAVFDTTRLPKSERILRSPSNENYQIRFSVEKAQKNGAIEVKVMLHVSDKEGKPIIANLSASVVDKNAVNWTDYSTILQAEQFKNLNSPFSYNESENLVDRWLIGKNLAKYDWANVLEYKPTGTIRMLENPAGVFGKILMKENMPLIMDGLCLETTNIPDLDDASEIAKAINGKAANKVQLVTYDAVKTEPVKLSEIGYFSIPVSSLLIKKSQTKVLKLRSFNPDVQSIELTDFPGEFDEKVRNGNLLNTPIPFNTVTKYVPTVEKSLTKDIQLREVSVEAKGNGFNDNIGKKGDYVCTEYNVFNCIHHTVGGKKPEAGMVYNSDEIGFFLYNGVGKYFTTPPDSFTLVGTRAYWPIPNISMPRMFYQPQLTDTAFLKTDIRNTVYWSPNLNTDESGNQQFNFCTSNRKGTFTIIIQGIDSKTWQAIFGRYEFSL